ncbi:c-type cytochrome [Thiohalobacter sp.]|uniref:c-type cytochrome n=1 Tax=Thiohalobacter sp. TaxID=2025948 RepID=UPI0026392148|nr:cytochrome c [Thiohalobacter sp.]
MNKRIALLAAPLALAVCLPVHAAGDANAGKTKAATCQACHGPDGNSVDPQYPRLAGQYADYLVQALKDYKSGARNNPIMKGFAAGLSEQDMEDLAAYFSRQRGLVVPEAPKTVQP